MARAKTAEAFNLVLECLSDSDKKVALKAAEIILDRGYGKAAQAVALTGEDGGPIKIQKIERVVVDPCNPSS
jgi:hypothetical protein